jgi:hypothetical protein
LFSVLQILTVIGKTTQRRIDIVLKRKRDGYLANNLLVNIDGDILETTYNYEDVIADFSAKKDRKADF